MLVWGHDWIQAKLGQAKATTRRLPILLTCNVRTFSASCALKIMHASLFAIMQQKHYYQFVTIIASV